MTRICVLPAFLLVFSSLALAQAFGGGQGYPCDYALNGDSECDAFNGYYCAVDKCVFVSEFFGLLDCFDMEAPDIYSQASTMFVERNNDGSFLVSQEKDFCEWNGIMLRSCSGNSCMLKEWYCNASTIESHLFSCASGCANGACLKEVVGSKKLAEKKAGQSIASSIGQEIDSMKQEKEVAEVVGESVDEPVEEILEEPVDEILEETVDAKALLGYSVLDPADILRKPQLIQETVEPKPRPMPAAQKPELSLFLAQLVVLAVIVNLVMLYKVYQRK